MYHPVNRRELMDIVDNMINNGYTDFNNIDVSRITDFDDIFSKDTSYWLNDSGHYETRKRNPGSLQALPKMSKKLLYSSIKDLIYFFIYTFSFILFI